jgi:hypothetical protein
MIVVEYASQISRSGLVVKFVLAMHEPRVRFTAATYLLQILFEAIPLTPKAMRRIDYHTFCFRS